MSPEYCESVHEYSYECVVDVPGAVVDVVTVMVAGCKYDW